LRLFYASSGTKSQIQDSQSCLTELNKAHENGAFLLKLANPVSNVVHIDVLVSGKFVGLIVGIGSAGWAASNSSEDAWKCPSPTPLLSPPAESTNKYCD
jgi:hypothetical protein